MKIEYVDFENIIIEDLGEKEEWVYDIEVEDNHNFFANNILVHNSFYITMKGVVKKEFASKLNATTIDKVDFCLKFIDKYLFKFIQEGVDEVDILINGYNKSVMEMEQETTADKFVSVADKRYFCRKWYKYNGEYKSGYKMTGISLVSKSTPVWFKEKLKPVLDIVLDGDKKELMTYIDSVKTEVKNVENISDICVIKGVSNVDYTLTDDGKAYRIKTNGDKQSAPLHSRGAAVHNNLLDIKNDKKYVKIQNGDKVFYSYLLTPNTVLNQNVVCFINPKFIDDYNIKKFVDYDTMFEKNFLQNVKNITDRIGWVLREEINLDEWC